MIAKEHFDYLMSMNQQDRIVELLNDGKWHSVREFMHLYMPRYSAVLHALKERGYVFDKRTEPEKPHWAKTRLEEWRIVADPPIEKYTPMATPSTGEQSEMFNLTPNYYDIH